jgi:hypothetical protein
MSMNKLSWPLGWSVQTFHMAVLAARQHRIPDFSADVSLSPKSVRAVVQEVEELSEKSGRYIFDTHVSPEPWQPAPHIPRVVRESMEKVYVREYSSPERILQLSDAGQDEELLLTRACRDCGDIIVVTVGMAAQAIRKFNLQGGKYRPPWRCRVCKDRKRKGTGLRVSVGAQQSYKNSKTPAKEDQPAQ